jgi:hypothetical protein
MRLQTQSFFRYLFRLRLSLSQTVEIYRECLPTIALHAYFGGCQDHFHLKKLTSSFRYTQQDKQLYMISVRSDSCAHSLPTWSLRDRGTVETLDEDDLFEAMVKKIVHEDPTQVVIQHLDLIKSEASLRGIIESWMSTERSTCFILVVDMQLPSSSKLVNFVRTYVEQLSIPPSKKFLLLLHYPLSCSNPSYPSLFLGWECVYFDGIGYRDASSSHLSVNNVFEAACFGEVRLDTNMLVHALLSKATQYVSSQLSFYTCSTILGSVNHKMHFTERITKLESVLKSQINGMSLATLLSKKYLDMWTKDALRLMLLRAANGLHSGTTHLSLSSAIRSVLQHTFNRFLASSVKDLNTWCNLDILDKPDSGTNFIFLLVLDALPCVPLRELELQRDVYRHLNPLPSEVASKVSVFFPFYYHISSFIEMVLDEAVESTLSLGSDCSDLVLNVNNVLDTLVKTPSLSSLNIDQSMGDAIQKIIKAVERSPALYERYLKHLLLWKFGAKEFSRSMRLISNRVDAMVSATSSISNRNIVLLHAFCRDQYTDILRMTSWDVLQDASCVQLTEQLNEEKLNCEGVQFVSRMVNQFRSSIFEHSANADKWNISFSVFLQSFPNLLEDDSQLKDEAVIGTFRQLIFLHVAITVNAPDDAISHIVKYFNTLAVHTLCEFFRLLDKIAVQDMWVVDAKDKLLRIFFSPSWFNIVSDVNQQDAKFLIELINKGFIEHQRAVVHLRNLLLKNNRHNPNGLLPTKCFYQPIGLLICRNLSCRNISEYCEETQRRKNIPHYIPSWLLGVTGTVTGDDDISWFFRDYQNAFDCPLAHVVFEVMLGVLVEKAQNSHCSSEQLLYVFQERISSERNVSQRVQIQNARQSLYPSQKENVSFLGTCLSCIELDALLVCLVSKVTDELVKNSQAAALFGLGSEAATQIFEITMGSHKWQEFFFSALLKLRGRGHLGVLLSQGGALSRFDWCSQWKQGVVSVRQDIMQDLTLARDNLQQTERDVAHLSRMYQACPYCRGAFGVDQRNCGQFICGRDAHDVNGAPSIGGQAVGETHGCGRGFSLGQALPYEQSSRYTDDQTALQRLRQDLAEKGALFNAFNESAELWQRAEQFHLPSMKFYVQGGENNGVFPCANLVDKIPQLQIESPGVKLLLNVLNQLPALEHIAYLPDLIEVRCRKISEV